MVIPRVHNKSKGKGRACNLQGVVSTLNDVEKWQTSMEVLFIVHAGDSAVTTVTIESYTLFPSPRLFMLVAILISHNAIHEFNSE